MKVVEQKEKLVSIIMPAYNCEDYIEKAVNSVIIQTYKNWELIIIDDFSEDRTIKIINKYIDLDPRIYFYKLSENSGAAVARNTGIKMANGKYISFLDSDDIWKKEKLMKQINFMKKNNYDFTCTDYSKINDRGENLNKIIKSKKRSNYNELLKTSPGNSTVIYNVEKIGKILIPDIKKRNDYIMWLQVIKKTGTLYGLNESLSSHRVRKGSLSRNKLGLIRYHWIIYRKFEKLSMLKSIFLSIYWVNKSILKFALN